MPKGMLLIFGGNGFVGAYVARTARAAGWRVTVADASVNESDHARESVKTDISDLVSVRRAVDLSAPDAVVNAAAIADVDKAEQDRELARRVNVVGAAHVAQCCHERRVWHALISTDAVFDGLHPPYQEDSPVCPVNYYGRTKVEAEESVRAACPGTAIVRLSLVLGFAINGGNSFLSSFEKKLRAGQSLSVPTREIRTPIDVGTLADCLVALADGRVKGTLHVGATEPVSRHKLAARLAQVLGYDPSLVCADDRPPAIPGRAPRHVAGILDVSKARSLGLPLLGLEATIVRAVDTRTN